MTKRFLSILFILTFSASIAFISSCKKKDNSTTQEQLNSQAKQHNDDANNYKGESDQNDNDINGALNGTSLMSPIHLTADQMGRLGNGITIPNSGNIPCGATVDSSQIANKTIIFNFDGTTHCQIFPIRTRSGQITVHLANAPKWDSAGAVLTFTFNHYKVTRVDNGKSIEFNGTKTLINPNGFNWVAFYFGSGVGDTIFYKERVSNMQVTFDGSATATWNSARDVSWTHALATDVYTFSTIGDTTVNGYNHASEWGTNRYGIAFTTYYNASLISLSKCEWWQPTGGELVHHLSGIGDFTLNLGVDQHGNANSNSATTCGWGFKVTWRDSQNNTQYTLFPYL